MKFELTILVVTDGAIAKLIKDDVKDKLNGNAKDFASYRMGYNELGEITRQYKEAEASPVPKGFTAVVDSKDNVILGVSREAMIEVVNGNPVMTTPEDLPVFDPPQNEEDSGATKVIHSHVINAYIAKREADGEFAFTVLKNDDIVPIPENQEMFKNIKLEYVNGIKK